METETELYANILNIIRRIEDTSPELSKYISEMHVSISDSPDPKIQVSNLNEYYDSLRALLSAYQNPKDQ